MIVGDRAMIPGDRVGHRARVSVESSTNVQTNFDMRTVALETYLGDCMGD